MALTDVVLRKAVSSARETSGATIRDDHVAGLELRIQGKTAPATWSVRLTIKGTGRRIRVDLGSYPDLTLAKAREAAQAAKVSARRGEDPRLQPQLETREVLTLSKAVERFHADSAKRSRDQEKRRFELHVLEFEKLGQRDVAAIEKKDVARLLQHLKHKKHLTAEVNRVRASISALFNWLIRQGEAESNPVIGTEKLDEPSIRRQREGEERVLSLDELISIWCAAERDVSSIASVLVRLLILVPLRREEWTGAKWSDISEEDGTLFLTIPADRLKGKRRHVTPLPPVAAELVRAMPRFSGGDWIFTTDGAKPYGGWGRASKRLKKEAALESHWTIHDIRRGVATAMGEVGVAESTTGRILAHSSRSRMGVTAVYDRSQRSNEILSALREWEAVLLGRLKDLKAHVGS